MLYVSVYVIVGKMALSVDKAVSKFMFQVTPGMSSVVASF